MVPNYYNDRNCKTILEKLHEKGWGVYKSKNPRQHTEHLEVNEIYVLLPKLEAQKDSGQPPSNLEKSVTKADRKISTIEIHGKRYKWTGFSLYASQVIINTSEGIFTTYPNFIKSLESITNINGAE